MDSFMSSGSGVVTQAKLDDLITDFIINTGQSFTVVQSEEFKKLVLAGLPGKKVLSYETLMSRIKTGYTQMKEGLREAMGKADHICITVDAWTAARRSFMGVTAHWIDSELNRKSAAIACARLKGRHTHDVLARSLDSVLKDYSIQNKVSGAITDGGANFIKAFSVFRGQATEETETQMRESDESENGDDVEPVHVEGLLEENENAVTSSIVLPERFYCAAHKLNLVASVDADNALKDGNYKRVARAAFAKANELWNKQNRSQVNADTIKDVLGRFLITPGTTRWNGKFDAMSLLVEITRGDREKMATVMDKLGLNRFSSAELTCMEEYVTVMRHVAKALDILQGEKNCHIGILLPVIAQVQSKINQEKEHVQMSIPLCDAISAGLERRFQSERENKTLILSSLVHPRFKVSWLEREKQEAAWIMLRDEIEGVLRSSGGANTQNREPAETATRQEKDDLDDFFPVPLVETRAQGAEAILEQFKGCSAVDQIKDNATMKKLFQKYNCLLPSSASVERLFSCGGSLFRKNRFSMHDSSFEMQLLMKMNKNLL